LPLQAAADADLEHRPVRLANRQFERRGSPLSLKASERAARQSAEASGPEIGFTSLSV
jgi:hypothetical protein